MRYGYSEIIFEVKIAGYIDFYLPFCTDGCSIAGCINPASHLSCGVAKL